MNAAIPNSPSAFDSTTGTSSPSSTSSQQAPSNTLDADSFITLLTAQLQAQDPLNPLDPNQMVDELTSMNTLQQIIQIRQDMDTLVGAAQGPTGSLGTSGASASSGAANVAAQKNASRVSAAAALFNPTSFQQ
ncbi:MAG TPA: flagellar hook capping FlgD N-terminal domain-containing protein [Candidatus Acidoferrum sp.]|nr:flagellar hook capping FlgD N-terminal domain-containing protein [Candidatus Acidoferrum sp.]